MLNYKDPFTKFIYRTNISGSNKAQSYISALEWLSKMLESESFGFYECINIWSVNSVDRLHELYLLVLDEARKGDESIWNIEGIPRSYLQKGYCSAALKSYQEFLVEYIYEQNVLTVFNEHKGDESDLLEKINHSMEYPDFLIEGLNKKEGIEVIRSVSVRLNQNIFRKMILKIYNQSCCITGLDIPEINRASHIIPWSEDVGTRLDPCNGLCLSATYDAAFDRNLISLDEDFRIILSKDIKDRYTSKSVKEYFMNKEGEKITLPSEYIPNKDYLAVHRERGMF